MSNLKIYDCFQGTDEWLALRRGILTASQVNTVLTPKKLEPASSDAVFKYACQLAVDRIYGYPHDSTFSSWDMERGQLEEDLAREEYERQFDCKVEQIGFATNVFDGVTIGASPDSRIAGGVGLLEIKSRINREQVRTFIKNAMPDGYRLQVQTQMLVLECEWCDFVSYSNGMPLYTRRYYADASIQAAIIEAAKALEEKVTEISEAYLACTRGLPPVEHRDYAEMFEIQV